MLLLFILCLYYWHSRLVIEFCILIYYLNLVHEFDIPVWYSNLVFKFDIWCPTWTWHISINVPDNPHLIGAFSLEADTHVDLVLIPSLFIFPHTSLPFVFNCDTGIKSLPYVCTRVYSPNYRTWECLPYTTMFRVSRFSPPASIFNQHIYLLNTCPREYIFFSINSMSSYHQRYFSFEYLP